MAPCEVRHWVVKARRGANAPREYLTGPHDITNDGLGRTSSVKRATVFCVPEAFTLAKRYGMVAVDYDTEERNHSHE